MLQIMLANQQKMGGSGAVQRLRGEFYELLVQSEYVDEASPDILRRKGR